MTNQQGAPEALTDPSPDQLRAIARTARNSSGSASDDCGPLAYVLHGWRAAAIAFRAQLAALVEAQQPAPAQAADSQPAPTHAQIAAYLEATGAYVTNDATRKAAIAEAVNADRAARAPADSVLEDAALSSEQQRAIFEAYESAASESYFEVRPQIDCNDRRRVFKAGYERGWDAASKKGANHD